MQGSNIPLSIVKYLYSTFGTGFGDRMCSLCLGLNMYAAIRGSSTGQTRAAPNLLEGPTTIINNEYYRKHFVDVQMPSAYKFINQLGTVASGNAILLDPIMTGALSRAQGLRDKRTLCSKGIVTSGSPSSGVGFGNSCHKDVNDMIIDRAKMEEFQDELHAMSGTELSDDAATQEKVERKLKYIMRFWDRFKNLSVPTTCHYEFVGDLFSVIDKAARDEATDSVQAYFLFPGLGIVVPIVNELGLQFYAAIVDHHTSMTIMVSWKTSEVFYTADEEGYIFAWGAAGSNNATTGATAVM